MGNKTIFNLKINGVNVLSRDDNGKWKFMHEADTHYVNQAEYVLHMLEEQNNKNNIEIAKNINKNLEKASQKALIEGNEKSVLIQEIIKQFKNNPVNQ